MKVIQSCFELLKKRAVLLATGFSFWTAVSAIAQTTAPAAAPATTTPAPVISAGDTAWVLVSAALVLLMTPGLAFFYGGMVRRKNVLGILMQCFACLSVVSL